MSNIPALPPEFPEDPNAILGRTFRAYLATVWQNPVPCPVCKSDDWEIKAAVDLRVRYLEDKAITAMPVQCKVCKHILLFNGVAAGLFDENGAPRPDYVPPPQMPPPAPESPNAPPELLP